MTREEINQRAKAFAESLNEDRPTAEGLLKAMIYGSAVILGSVARHAEFFEVMEALLANLAREEDLLFPQDKDKAVDCVCAIRAYKEMMAKRGTPQEVPPL